MRGIPLPDRADDFTADPSELFFDLAFVFAFSQLVGRLFRDPTWGGVGEAGLLFLFLWIVWSQFTWSANAVSGNSRPARVFILVATAASVPMAAAVGTAYEDSGSVFMISLSVIFVMGLATLALALEPGTAERASLNRYALTSLIAISVTVIGSFLDDEARVVLWLVGLFIYLGGTVAAGSGDWVVRTGHFAERHGLILIVALGEVIVALGIPVAESLGEGHGFPAATVVALAAAGTLAVLLWWGYFDRVQPAIENRAELQSGRDRARFVRDVYTYLHAPVVAGVILAAAALEEITLHPTDAVPDRFRLMLLAGVGLFLLGQVAAVARAFGVLAQERLAAAAVVAAVVAVADSWDGVILLVAIDVVIVAALVAEYLRVEYPYRDEVRAST